LQLIHEPRSGPGIAVNNLSHIRPEKAIKKWVSPLNTREGESEYFIYSGAIRRVEEDISWLAEPLAALAREIG